MLFDMRRHGNTISGWVAPDNPGLVSKVRIVRPDGSTAELATNRARPDVVEHGLHHNGQVGFAIDASLFPDLASILDTLEVREFYSGVLLYRGYRDNVHIPMKVFRFDLQAMPYAHIEAIWDRNFALYYNGVERYNFDTLFGILNNPAATSVALAGRLNLSRYEHFFRERDYKLVTLLRHPLEELAERLLFVRYALAPQSASTFEGHLTGLKCLEPVAREINLDTLNGLPELFRNLTDEQKAVLENPMLRTIACEPDERPRRHHIELALSKLSSFDLVGVRSQYARFVTMLDAILERPLFAGTTPADISLLGPLARALGTIKPVRALLALDIQLYELAERAVQDAIGLGVPHRHEQTAN